VKTLMRNESKGSRIGLLRWDPLSFIYLKGSGAASTDHFTCERFELEHICWDPKDGELCLDRVKPGETLVEARSETDVQIVRLIWV
jgi:hypothetical protein